MADIRIKVAKDKAKLVKALRAGEGSTGLFQTYYEVLLFVAVLGLKHSKFMPFADAESSKEIDPIRQEQFASKGYSQIIDLIALSHSKKPKVLALNTDEEQVRTEIFQGYSNGGLSILKEILKGAENDYSNQIILLMSSERATNKVKDNDPLDLDFLT